MQSAARLERIRLWRKRAWLVAFVAWWAIGLIGASATCVAQEAIKPTDQHNGTLSEDTAATAVFIVEAKKCENKAPRERDAWSEPERWAWQQICQHLNVDFDEREANSIVDKEVGKESPEHDVRYRQKLEELRARNYHNPERLATDESRRLSGKFLAMIFGDVDLRQHTWNEPLRFFGFSTDQFVIDTAALKSLDMRNAYIGKFLIQNTTIDGYLRFENAHLASIKIDTARIGDRLSILEGHYGTIDLEHVKVDDLFIYHPAWNSCRESSKPELSITESVDNGVFTFQANPEGALPERIKLDQFIFANAYLGPDPMPVIHAMDADAMIRTSGRPDLEPYTLIAKSYAERGETSISDHVLIARDNQDRHLANILSLDFVGLTFTWLVAVYGFHPELGFAWIGGFVLLGWAVFWSASGRLAADSYRPKSPFLLALDSVIPGIQLDKNNQDVRYDGWPQIMLYLLRILGAVLVFVALWYLQKRLLG